MFSFRDLTKKQIFSFIAAALIIPAFWEYIGKPGLEYLFKGFLVLGNFLHSTVRDAVYQEIAKGLYERETVLLASLFFILPTVYILIRTIEITSRRRERLIEKNKNLKELKVNNPDAFEKHLIKTRNSLILIAVLLVLMSAFPVAQLQYKSNAISRFNQALRICRPYLTEEEYTKIESEFSSIENSQDYLRLYRQLESLAKTNGKKLPEFWIW